MNQNYRPFVKILVYIYFNCFWVVQKILTLIVPKFLLPEINILLKPFQQRLLLSVQGVTNIQPRLGWVA